VGCEPGSYCKDGICVPQVFRGLPCETDAQCVSGKCEMGAVAKFCATETECFVPLQL
jgi:hypothetical protein